MPRIYLFVALTALAAPIAHADPLDALVGGTDPTLTHEQIALLDALKRNLPEDTETQSRPVIGVDNTVQYVFGQIDPTAICTPFDGCDIRLEPGEIVHDPSMADRRWQVDVLFEGEAPREIPHVAVYPTVIGLKATLVIPTNRRTYHIHLISRSPSDDTPSTTKIAFLYPEDIRERFAAARARQELARTAIHRSPEPPLTAARPEPRITTTPVFGYEIKGRAPWKPLRVFNDGETTMIDFPDAVRNTELPSFLMRRTEGDLFHDDELVLVNHHWDPQGLRMQIDCVFDHGVLIAGVGRNQVRIGITRLPQRR